MSDKQQIERYQSARFIHYIVIIAVTLCCLWLAWTGYIASDDAYYAVAGAKWANQFPFVAQYFAEARFVIAAPIGVMIKIFGESEFTVILSTCLFFIATVSVTLALLSRQIGATAATLVCSALCTVPMLALKSTTPSADIPELFFVSSSIWLFWLAMHRENKVWLLMLSGACTSLAFGAHEVTGGLIIGYSVLFLFGYGILRREYWIMALGFFGVIGIECIYYWIFAGDPFHRLAMLIPIASAGSGLTSARGDRVDVETFDIALGGTLHINEALDPILMFFTHHDFGLLGYAALPALWWCFVTSKGDQSVSLKTARLFSVFALIWFLFSALLLRHSILITRYYMVTCYLLFIVTALWIVIGVWPNRKKLAIFVSSLLVVGNLISIYLDNKEIRFGERSLIAFLAESNGPIHVDPTTARRARLYCKWSGQDCTRLKSDPPTSGLYFYIPSNSSIGVPATVKELQRYQPDPTWPVIWQRTAKDKPLTTVARLFQIEKWLPSSIYNKIAGSGTYVKVYKIPDRQINKIMNP